MYSRVHDFQICNSTILYVLYVDTVQSLLKLIRDTAVAYTHHQVIKNSATCNRLKVIKYSLMACTHLQIKQLVFLHALTSMKEVDVHISAYSQHGLQAVHNGLSRHAGVLEQAAILLTRKYILCPRLVSGQFYISTDWQDFQLTWMCVNRNMCRLFCNLQFILETT